MRSTRSNTVSKTTVGKDIQKKKAPTSIKSEKGEKSQEKLVTALAVDLDNTPHVTRSRGEAAAVETHEASFSFPASNFQVILRILEVHVHV